MSFLLCCIGIIVYISNGLQITNTNLFNSSIICPINDDCIIECNSNNGYNCQKLNLSCQNNINGSCILTCIGKDACTDLRLNAINVNHVQITCSEEGTHIHKNTDIQCIIWIYISDHMNRLL